jgi:hypothetical protein
MLSKISLRSLVLSLSMYAGCSPSEYSDFEFGDTQQGSLLDNGVELNGLKQNGLKQNGLKQNGLKQNGIGLHVASITDGNITTAADADLTITFSSSQLNQTVIDADLENGETTKFRIDSVSYSASLGTSLYFLSNWDPTTATWESACGIDPTGTYAPAGTLIPAVAFSDTWNLVDGANVSDPDKFTFSCVNAAIGKCVVWGYKRWANQQECNGGNCKTQDLAFFHQACTRLVRADYCGDGKYHTRNGTAIDVFDNLGIQNRDGAAGNSLEADWRYDGAHCLRHTRWTKADPTLDTAYATDLDYVAATCPSRLASNDASCADPNASHFFKANGFNDSLADRVVLRNESYQH